MKPPGLVLTFALWMVCRLSAAVPGASSMNYHRFENFLLSREALSVRCFMQDGQGLMWIGTDKGLFSYDGFRPRPHFAYADSMNMPVNCALLYNDRLLLGTQKGVRVYNYRKDAYEPFPLPLRDEVQAIALQGGDLWIGTMSGLFHYDMHTQRCRPVALDTGQAKPRPMVYSVLADGGRIYVGTNLFFGCYDPQTGRFERILPAGEQGMVFVNTLLKDTIRQCIWIGTSHALAKYIPQSRKVELVNGDFPFIKAMSLDRENNLVIGTDNGLCLYSETRTGQVRHDSRDDKSLANNIVWATYTDPGGNVWLGTDYGVSRAPDNRHFEYIPIHRLTQSADGNHVYSILRDSHGYFWLGGTSGLIRAGGLHPGASSRRYMMNHPQWNIAHNRIRHIYEDRSQTLRAVSFGMGLSHDGRQQGGCMDCYLHERYPRGRRPKPPEPSVLYCPEML